MGKIQKSKTGFSIVEIIIIMFVIGLLGGAGWYVLTNRDSNPVSTTPAKTESKPAAQAKDPTYDWTVFKSDLGKFALRYPPSWKQPVNREYCNPDLFDRSLYLGPDQNSTLKCATEFFGQMSVGSTDGDKRSEFDLSDGYKDIEKKDVTVDKVKGQRLYAIASKPNDDVGGPGVAIDGTIFVRYVFFTNDITYSATYKQAPANYSPSTNVLADFDTMITKTLTFTK